MLLFMYVNITLEVDSHMPCDPNAPLPGERVGIASIHIQPLHHLRT